MTFDSGDVPSILTNEIPEELMVDAEIEKNSQSTTAMIAAPRRGRKKKDNSSDVITKSFEFTGFDPRCKTCQLALHDSKINELFYKNRQIGEVYKYIQATHKTPPSYRSISHHCKYHLESPDTTERRELQRYTAEVNSYVAKIKTMSDIQEIDKIKAVVAKNIEKLDSQDYNDPVLLCETRKTINALFKTYLDCKNYELKRAGVGATAEELENRVKAFCSELIENIIKNEKVNKANEIINIIQKNMPTNL